MADGTGVAFLPSSYQDWPSFKERVVLSSSEHSSRVVLALNLEGVESKALYLEGEKLLRATSRFLCGVRMGRQTVLNLGIRYTRLLIGLAHELGLPCIIDDKLNDIDDTNRAITSAYFRIGFDAIIVNPFAGWEGGLEPVFQLASKKGKGVIVLVYMSHPAALGSYGQRVVTGRGGIEKQYIRFARDASRWRADGVVVGATRPNIVREVSRLFKGSIPIYSPGVGAQGGDVKAALRAGTSYFIVGRSITESKQPANVTRRFARMSVGFAG